MIFFIPSSNLGAVHKDSTPVKFSYSFAVFSKLEKTKKFEKTRIRLNSDVFPTLAINIFKAPYIHERYTFISVLPQSLLIEGGKHHDSIEELFTLQNTEELKVIVKHKVFTFDFGFKISRDLTKPGPFSFFWIHASLYVNSVNVALSQKLKKATEYFFKLLRDVIKA